MAQQKPTFSLRISATLKEAIEDAFAKKEMPSYTSEERREIPSTGAFAGKLLEFVWLQYETAGSLKKLLSTDLQNLENSLSKHVNDMVSKTTAAQEKSRPESRQVHDSVSSSLRKSAETRVELRKRAHAATDKKHKTGTD